MTVASTTAKSLHRSAAGGTAIGAEQSALLRAAETVVLELADPHLLVDGALRILSISPACAALLGAEDIDPGAALADLRHASGPLRLLAADALQQMRVTTLEDIGLGEGAGRGRFDIAARPLVRGSARGVLVTLTPRRAVPVETLLARFLPLLLADRAVPLVLFDGMLRLRDATRAAAEIPGIGPLTPGTPARALLADVLPDSLVADLEQVAADGGRVEKRHARAAGTFRLMALPGGRRPADVALVFLRDAMPQSTNLATAEELNHRLKNVLGVAASIATLMLDDISDVRAFHAPYVRRIQALARANSLVSRSNWGGTDIHAVFSEQLAPYMQGAEDRVRVHGPTLILRARAAVTLGMAVHEMVANAVEHGALAYPRMALDIGWKLVQDGGEAQIVIEWVETGGGNLPPPRRKGFGSALIEQGVAHELSGSASLLFAEHGMAYRIRLPVIEVIAPQAEGA